MVNSTVTKDKSHRLSKKTKQFSCLGENTAVETARSYKERIWTILPLTTSLNLKFKIPQKIGHFYQNPDRGKNRIVLLRQTSEI